MHKAILIMGPPGAGKGTQADLIADNLGFFHFDSGRYIARLIEKSKKGKLPKDAKGPPKTRSGKTELERGLLTDPLWFLKLVKAETYKLAKADLNVVFSGSPRTVLEAFGDKKNLGLVPWLIKLYGKKNISVFKLDIPLAESLKRNSRRITCSLCRKSLVAPGKLDQCPFCGGSLIKRSDDKPAIIKIRLREYRERTGPVMEELEKRGFKIIRINGRPRPNIVFRSLEKHI